MAPVLSAGAPGAARIYQADETWKILTKKLHPTKTRRIILQERLIYVTFGYKLLINHCSDAARQFVFRNGRF